ncbi:MAG: hypothetical protein M0D55_14940 [Elusimicrobiota bacterium]|nr:MAG: hypothetical protein M0D55_14940 [Elusimicrobiota bacterium]
MKRLLLAAILVLPLSARAEATDAYGTLLAMGESAKTDRGPAAEESALPPDQGRDRRNEEKGAAPDDEADALNPEAAPVAARQAPAVSTSAAPAPAKDDERPAVTAPAQTQPRVWTRVFASLLPPMRPASGIPTFEIAASTAPARPRIVAVRPVTPASQAGAAQGLLEVVAMATAPSDSR